jgi:pyruvate-ferredoxin/flavodoxin oxidoreductase
MCSLYCPHGAIRPFLLTEEEAAKAPETFKMVQGKMSQKDFKFRIQVSSMDCTGCSVCASACPVKCLTMKSFQEVGEREAANWEFAMTIPTKESAVDKTKLRDTMFNQPLLEFSGACEGCNETALVKLATQLFGNRMVIANATGCSSIWGATWGTNPYTVDAKGRGPAWGNSLFEDNAEYGFGMFRANKQRRALLLQNVKEAIEEGKVSAELKALLQEWTEKLEDADECDRLNLAIKPLIEKEKDASEIVKAVYNNSDMFVKISQWIIGGDGWALVRLLIRKSTDTHLVDGTRMKLVLMGMSSLSEVRYLRQRTFMLSGRQRLLLTIQSSYGVRI